MKTTILRVLVVTFVFAAFALLSLSPIRAQSSASSNNQDGPMGCCGNQNSQISCPNGYTAVATGGNAQCVKTETSSNNTSSNNTSTTTTGQAGH